jgi:hypothetical protein
MKVYIVFAYTSGTGGFEFRYKLADAQKQYEADIALGCQEVVTVAYEAEATTTDEIVDEIDYHHYAFEAGKAGGVMLASYQKPGLDPEELRFSYPEPVTMG